MGNLEHLRPEVQEVALKSEHERMLFVSKPVWLGYNTANQILDRMCHIMKYPTKPRIANMLVIGEPNSGKTSIANRFTSLHGNNFVNDLDEPNVPVVLINAPSNPDADLIDLAILEKLLIPNCSRGKKGVLTQQTLNSLKNLNVKILLIDEIHNLFACSAMQQRKIMNHIKNLCNTVEIPIVAFGTEDALNILHHDKQHRDRFGVAKLDSWNPNKDFQSFIATFESILPLRKASKLSSPEKIKLIWMCTKGSTGAVKQLLIECAHQSIQNGQEAITVDQLKERHEFLQSEHDRGIWDLRITK